ncbi:hypothetical protein GCM10023345_08270 [Acinetobacter kookii]|uniref:Uncharacterized protein n=1 Tax=Acinetobacter kookii TaxID=1226327 RepID=A0A1G6H8Y3_9GAMM|nr:hypothetical protein [Acinetobacter kookii]SDB90747.1 hypothetical protein SAMN05421732_101842 [Acinetobacter kookii]
MNKTASMIGACILAIFGGTAGLGIYLYNSQTTNVQRNVLTQSNNEGSNLNHSSVQNVTYNIHHNHYYTTEQKAK